MAIVNPLVFVAMPFGKRKDETSGIEIDFDHIYEKGVVPASKGLGIDIIRGDEEHTGGIIMRSVFERLLLSEIVIADLTMQNPNVFYELGVRHSARPRSTILMFAHTAPLPFDVQMVRAVPYDLDDGLLTEDSAERLIADLRLKLSDALKEGPADSPLSQLIPELKSMRLSHDLTDTFRDRVVGLNQFKDQIFSASKTKDETVALTILHNTEKELGELNETNAEIFVDLMLAYRSISAWDDVIRTSHLFSLEVSIKVPIIIEVRALALNKRNEDTDRANALRALNILIEKYGTSPERCGLVGSVYKKQYEQAAGIELEGADYSNVLSDLRREDSQARGYLSQAIEWYGRGYAQDIRDYYTGINEATLRYIRGNDQDVEKLETLLPALAMAVAHLGGIGANDYWVVATVLELNILRECWEETDRLLEKMFALEPDTWMLKSTAVNLNLIKEVRRIQSGDISRLTPLIDAIVHY